MQNTIDNREEQTTAKTVPPNKLIPYFFNQNNIIQKKKMKHYHVKEKNSKEKSPVNLGLYTQLSYFTRERI